jgi:hypothetical protein
MIDKRACLCSCLFYNDNLDTAGLLGHKRTSPYGLLTGAHPVNILQPRCKVQADIVETLRSPTMKNIVIRNIAVAALAASTASFALAAPPGIQAGDKIKLSSNPLGVE